MPCKALAYAVSLTQVKAYQSKYPDPPNRLIVDPLGNGTYNVTVCWDSRSMPAHLAAVFKPGAQKPAKRAGKIAKRMPDEG